LCIFEVDTMPNEFKDIIQRLEKQKAAIDRALAALREVDDNGAEEAATTRRGRPGKVARKRKMSEEGRKRIAEAQRKRWATKKGTKRARSRTTKTAKAV
jgi:hypothetical protein